jgi:haloalkane dehalogenase
MGRSDKPVDINDYSYLGHADRLEQFIQALGLSDINLFVQDWGSLIGLRVAGLNPDWFATISVGNGDLFIIPEGFQPFSPVENPNEMRISATHLLRFQTNRCLSIMVVNCFPEVGGSKKDLEIG